MSSGIIIGLVAGIAAGFGIYFALRAMGFFQYMGGKKRSSIPAVNKEALMSRLLRLNDLAKPYSIIEGKDTDLIAEWKIADAAWFGIFSKSHFSQSYRALLLVDEERHTVRCYEELGSLEWMIGSNGLRPVVHYRTSFFRGRILARKEIGKAYAIKSPEGLEAGKVYDYKFDIDEIRQPIISTVLESGWEWVPVTAKRYATFKKPVSK